MKPTIYIHHDAYNLGGDHLALVDNQHKNEKYPKSNFGYYTFYQYFIERSGALIQTRPEMDARVVYKKVHENSISVCLAGNMNVQQITDAQKRALFTLLISFRYRYKLSPLDIGEHRDYQATSCPGDNISENKFAHFYNDLVTPWWQRPLWRAVINAKLWV